MTVRYLLDTNIVSYLLRGHSLSARTRFEKATVKAIGVSAVTEAEVYYGLARTSAPTRLKPAAEVFFASVTCFAWDSSVARTYGALRAEQVRKGRPLSTEDLMIAAHALALKLTLVTSDRAFSFVDGLKTEDWTLS